jgi:hypothetical protein
MGGAPPGAMPGGGAAPGGGAPEGQASGASPATMPAPNQGLHAVAMAKLAVIAQQMQMILFAMPVGSDVARDIRDALNKIAKHVPPGAVSQGVQMTEAQRNLMQQRQMGPQIATMRATQGGMPGGMPGGASPPPPAAA